jgi:two-component sensor histidine kinase
MYRLLTVYAIFLGWGFYATAQAPPNPGAQGYNEAQRRLLVRDMGRFLYFVTQGAWDPDSCFLYVCKQYGLSRQLPYDETINDGSINRELQWLDLRQPEKVKIAADQAVGDRRIRLLLELAVYYLHLPRTAVAKTDSAAVFINAARKMTATDRLAKWQVECDALTGELLYYEGKGQESRPYFAAVANAPSAKVDSKRKAIGWHQWGLHLPFTDPTRLAYLERAYHAFSQLGLTEHAIEAFSDIFTYYFITNHQKTEQALGELLLMEQNSGYRHTMGTYYTLSYLKSMHGDYIGSLDYADSSLTQMTTTRDSMFYSLVPIRFADGYFNLREPYKYFDYAWKALQRKNRDPKLFWYRYVPVVAEHLARHVSSEKALRFLDSITLNSPPESLHDSMSLNIQYGYNFDAVGKPVAAEIYYDKYLSELERLPQEHIHMQEGMELFVIAEFQFGRKRYDLARRLAERSLGRDDQLPNISVQAFAYQLLSRLDSISGNFRSALKNQQKYKFWSDSFKSVMQIHRNHELNVRYETGRKDQDIASLRQQGLLKESALREASFTRNILFAGVGLLIIIAALFYNQIRVRKKNAHVIEQKNAALEQLVDEKQWLLKEVHHRVKNSLQTIVSLLELQADSQHLDPVSAIQASQNRIFATSLLHQKLYQGDNMSAVNMGAYLPELVYYLQEAFHTRRRIDFQMSIEPIDLDVSQAVPIGIIINEVVTNAIKHAFPPEIDHATISISLAMADRDTALLQIADNGKGISPEMLQGEKGLGWKLVSGLTEDIDGLVEVVSGLGTTVAIRFKPRPVLNRVNTIQATIT